MRKFLWCVGVGCGVFLQTEPGSLIISEGSSETGLAAGDAGGALPLSPFLLFFEQAVDFFHKLH
jgi:hypothetical protein